MYCSAAAAAASGAAAPFPYALPYGAATRRTQRRRLLCRGLGARARASTSSCQLFARPTCACFRQGKVTSRSVRVNYMRPARQQLQRRRRAIEFRLQTDGAVIKLSPTRVAHLEPVNALVWRRRRRPYCHGQVPSGQIPSRSGRRMTLAPRKQARRSRQL